jgi:hypothetical protein
MAQLINTLPEVVRPSITLSETGERTFITANTVQVSLQEICNKHITPVFVRDNETVISHVDFIEATQQVVADTFWGERISSPVIRVSHPIKGRTPDAKDKPANQLLEHEQTLFYERMMFMIEVPGILGTVDGNQLSLCIGGVKSYAEDNLYSRSVSNQSFSLFIGFNNQVCCNMCIRTDGHRGELKVKSFDQLHAAINTLVKGYQAEQHLNQLIRLADYTISEQQFAQVVGRSRMYNHLPTEVKKGISPLLFNDTQLTAVCRDYYSDASFCKEADGNINLWRMYNLLTGANKTSYIDRFLDRSVNAYSFVEQIKLTLEGKCANWYLS